MIFAFDRIAKSLPYPNLGQVEAMPGTDAWYTFSKTYPFVEPFALYEYLVDEGVEDIHVRKVDQLSNTEKAWYPIVFTFFDFTIDYINLIPITTRELIKNGQLHLLFYYSEGDNPERMRIQLESLCTKHDICTSKMKIISANTAADDQPNMIWFADDELLYRKRNAGVFSEQIPASSKFRSKLYTLLVRTHKTWRANTAAAIYKEVGSGCFLGYNTNLISPMADEENPLEVSPELHNLTEKFLANGPYLADNLSSDAHNNYRSHVSEHFADSYINIILETHLDVDGSGGAFLTEKTFKPIKHGQPFVIFGGPGSLAALRKLGYKTFDNIIDPTYDTIQDTNKRWKCLMQTISNFKFDGYHNISTKTYEDCMFNRSLFLASKKERLNTLLERINNDH